MEFCHVIDFYRYIITKPRLYHTDSDSILSEDLL